MSVLTYPRATVADLYHVPEHGKAEIVNGELVTFMPTGRGPSRASSRIWRSLDDYELAFGNGVAVADNASFIVDLPHRQSFSPDAAWYVGPEATAATMMKFFPGAPVFAAEVRSENDYGPTAEREMAAKRRDYFAVGTLVVWDVDLLSDDAITVYRADAPTVPTVYRRGEIAEAEPAVPGWRIPVDNLFR